ncbi:MAG: chlorite dismutase family protein [Methylacidiphilales bacterium]|nr:chlorite dismutase family protein [Candidatus Methylacidiphilales bacterium]MDW8348832.1 chlorite dismutase family protein [Verrucomicrobiae bacterium]
MLESLSLKAAEGLFVVHLFLRVDFAHWAGIPRADQEERLGYFEKILTTRANERKVQVKFILMGGKADAAVMMLGVDRMELLVMERELLSALGENVLKRVWSYFSMTEVSEYTTTESEYRLELLQQGIEEGSERYQKELAIRLDRLKSYTIDRLYPRLPDWRFFCFYPMSKRRAYGQNWYELPFEERKSLMKGHAAIGRKYAGKVLQLVSGSIGLDDWEWGVTLFAHEARDVKAIVTEMRYDPTSARYAEFGPFYTGILVPLMAEGARLQTILAQLWGINRH